MINKIYCLINNIDYVIEVKPIKRKNCECYKIETENFIIEVEYNRIFKGTNIYLIKQKEILDSCLFELLVNVTKTINTLYLLKEQNIIL